jgi:arylsulfatase A-like enzyme
MITGPGISRGRVDTPVSPHDVAPTISNYLGISTPSGSTGTPLPYNRKLPLAAPGERKD